MLSLVERGVELSEEMQILAQEPFMIARKLNSYTTNGFDFHTHSSDDGRPIQNSGVAIAAQNSRGVEIYYGIIREIVELNYRQKGYMVLFRCDWVDNREQDKWVKTDQFGVTTVNFNHLFSSGDKLSDEPFILASQAHKFSMFQRLMIKAGVQLSRTQNHMAPTLWPLWMMKM